MVTKVCNCGAELHISKFRSTKRKMTDLCPACRHRKRNLENYHRKSKHEKLERLRRETRVALMGQKNLLDDEYVTGMFREIRRLRAQPARRLRVLYDSIANNKSTVRTANSIKWQQQKLAYYEDIERIMRMDLEHQNLRPVDFYLTNTYLLYKHGFNVAVVDNNPEVMYD